MLMKDNTGTSGIKGTVENIFWERIHLTIQVRMEKERGAQSFDFDRLEFYAVNNIGEARVKFRKEVVDDHTVNLKVNVTNNGQKRVIPTGTYRIFACDQKSYLAEMLVNPDIVQKLEDYSRGYLYSGQNKAYNVKFYVADDEDALKFRMRTVNTARAGLNFPKNPNFFKQECKVIKLCFFNAHVVVRLVYQFFSLFYKGRRNKNILFLTEQSTTIKSNLKAVSERMLERGLDHDFKIRFSARKVADKTQSGFSWVGLAIKLAKSGIIFVDDHAPLLDWLLLGDDVEVIQLWHAGAGFKSSGYSRWGQIGPPGPISAHRQNAYGIAGSKHIAPFFSEVWGINDECVLPTGMPRMDEYLDENHKKQKIKELYEEFPMCKGKKVILFAPTYRGNNAEVAYYPYDKIDFKRLYEVCGDEYVCLFKMHPWVIEDITIPEEYKDRFMDVKNYPNINDMFYITDLLITDYSSSIFEFSLMRKPMLFFAYDKIQYGFARGFHRPYEESAPGKVVYEFEDLMKAIEEKDFEFEKVEDYVEKHFDYIDSGASDRVIDWFLLGKMPEEFSDAIAKINKEMNLMMELDFGSQENK